MSKDKYGAITRDSWDQYRSIQDSGMFNMMDPRAREMTDVSRPHWILIMTHYSALKARFDG